MFYSLEQTFKLRLFTAIFVILPFHFMLILSIRKLIYQETSFLDIHELCRPNLKYPLNRTSFFFQWLTTFDLTVEIYKSIYFNIIFFHSLWLTKIYYELTLISFSTLDNNFTKADMHSTSFIVFRVGNIIKSFIVESNVTSGCDTGGCKVQGR